MTEQWTPEENEWYKELKALQKELSQRRFAYDPTQDAVYRAAADQLRREGSRAMSDTMAKAAGLTGGYGSSYAQSAGQLAYETRLDRLANLLPDLYDRAAKRYDAETDELYDRLGLVTGRYDKDYQAYLDRADRAQKQENWQAEFDRQGEQWREKLEEDIRRWEAERTDKQNTSATDRSYAYRMAMLALQHGIAVSDELLKAAGIDRQYAEAIRAYFSDQ